MSFPGDYRCDECRERRERCPRCRALRSARQRRLSRKRRRKGRCYSCPRKAAAGRVRCQRCLDRNRLASAAHYARLQAEQSK